VVQLADITERRRVEDALDDSRDRLVSAFHEAPIGMALATLGGDWLQVNEAMCLTVGYSDEELLSKRLPDLIAPEEAEAMQRYLRQLTAGDVLGYHVETRVVRGDGEVIWVLLSVSLVHDYEGAPEYLLTEVQDISERKRVEEELEQGALLDALTGLPSRALLFDRLEQARRRLERTGTPFAVLFAAAKGFDELASQMGRERSDSALRDLSSRLRGAVRSGDTVARYGPDEFVIVCEQLASDAKVATIASRIVEQGTFRVGEGESAQRVSVNVGMTVAADSGDSPGGLVERADAAMHAAEGESAGYEEYCDTL
jgi:PAS domain S-box-containing protein/diguanylate cyclase (GGDEF)-like protein